MGVPSFFRWLTNKYPSVVVNANEERQRDADGVRIPVDNTLPNPCFQEFDNLYLDMNGIIHPCTHPEDRPAPKNEDEMFALIFEYIDRIFSICRPRKVLYMAIDGVAPRAKMNQQRSRRFRASKEAWEKAASIEEVRRRLEEEGLPLPPKKVAENHFDSNCITPGTPFMARLADALRYYIHDRITNDPAWAKIEVILSDANAPGEGEHKIMDFIRKQRSNPNHNPDTVHVLCGADADLIMLGLATHEANFNIIREEFVPNQSRPCDLCGQYGHELKECRGLENEEKGEDHADPISKQKNFIFLRIPVLREYLELELGHAMKNLSFPFDLERAIDDWVFLCFFVGNDFLPHLPSLEIREGAIDRLIKLYSDMVTQMNGYLTKDGEVYMDRVQVIMNGLGEVEDEIFKRRHQKEEAFKAKKARFGPRPQRPAYVPAEGTLLAPTATAQHLSGEQTRNMAADARVVAMQFAENEEAAKRLKAMLKTPGESSSSKDETKGTPASSDNSRKRKANTKPKKKEKKRKGFNRPAPKAKPHPIQMAACGAPVNNDEEPSDDVRLHETGWKSRYYKNKFDVDVEDIAFRRKVAWAYVEGLCWVLKYYYQGCASWDWYFPYHYAPFASDFDNISEFKPEFPKATKPFHPLEQLMGVFPAASKQHLPVEWQKLMTDDDSPIIDLYPEDFRIDLNGKKFAWQGVALLPFVDEKRLLKTLESVYSTLTEEEVARNQTGPNRIFIGKNHPAFKFFAALYESDEKDENNEYRAVDVDPAFTYGMAGKIIRDDTVVLPGETFVSPVRDESCPDLPVNGGIMCIYEDPEYPPGFVYPATRLKNAKDLPRTLKPGSWNPDRDGQFRPQIGFNRDYNRASLDNSGIRHLNHELHGNAGYDSRTRAGHDNNDNYRRHSDGYQQFGRGRGGGGGYQGNGGGYHGGGGGGYNGNRGGGGGYQHHSRAAPYNGPARGGGGGYQGGGGHQGSYNGGGYNGPRGGGGYGAGNGHRGGYNDHRGGGRGGAPPSRRPAWR